MTIKFQSSKYELDLIEAIADRAIKLATSYGCGNQWDKLTAIMDIEACHCNGNPLALDLLLAAPDPDFAHDLFGIRRHIDRETGKLGDCFSPRLSQVYHANRRVM